jgi:hypothetical protein
MESYLQWQENTPVSFDGPSVYGKRKSGKSGVERTSSGKNNHITGRCLVFNQPSQASIRAVALEPIDLCGGFLGNFLGWLTLAQIAAEQGVCSVADAQWSTARRQNAFHTAGGEKN